MVQKYLFVVCIKILIRDNFEIFFGVLLFKSLKFLIEKSCLNAFGYTKILLAIKCFYFFIVCTAIKWQFKNACLYLQPKRTDMSFPFQKNSDKTEVKQK